MVKGVIVKIQVGDHKGSCKETTHDNCGLKEKFVDIFTRLNTDLEVSRSEIRNNLLKLEIRGKEEEKIKKNLVNFRINDFFSHHPMMTIYSLKIGARNW